ncbi:hypothetical protein GCM10025867_22560 [Frondihabitans sucicola]|uniref:Gram-positive cocci surface proteins LPxTG domain-containing protein n=1 Tax=Frondihabitans sucicola TaxID=1268041 RepID=A0ABM8GNJ6_9MICO|nr:hypothetical protein GCM10025867_22560 [Frondihabitans sucicola]
MRRALVVPAVLLLGLGGTALVATPAFAAPAATPAPIATPGPTGAPAVAPTAKPTATPSPTDAPTPQPAVRAAEPRDLTITSPNLTSGSVTIRGTRTLTLKGTAPAGSTLELADEWNGTRLTTVHTTGTTFTLSYTFADDAPYDQWLEVTGTHGTTVLSEYDFDAVFDHDTSATPTLDTPVDGTTFETAPLPLGLSTLAKPVTFSGTGTPGDDITLSFSTPGSTPDPDAFGLDDFGGFQADEIVVDDDNSWTGSAYVFYGDVSVSASQVQLGGKDSDQEVTQESDLTDPIDITMKAPKGTVLPPEITKPAYPVDDSFGFSIGAGVTQSSSTTAGSATSFENSSRVAARLLGRTTATSANPAASGLVHTNELRARVQAKAAPSDDAVVATDDSDDGDITDDQAVKLYGIQVKGTASADAPGSLTTTVSGTGTPGDGVVLYLDSPTASQAYFEKLYPKLFAGLSAEPTDDSVLFPGLSDDPGTVASLLPADDHSITVGADGTWTTTVTLKPGPYYFAAFQTSTVGAAKPVYSVASGLLPVNLTGTPLAAATVDPANQLAFTGSNSGPALALGLSVLAAGGALLVIARRRRPTV